MSSEWHETLTAAGAHIADAGIIDFGDPTQELAAAAGGEVFTVLSHYGVIAATGSDAGTLLQGQFTTDVREVDEAHSRLGALCSPKGRILVKARLIGRHDGYLLFLPATLLGGALQRLRMYILRADVRLEDASGQWVAFGLQGRGVIEAAGIAAGDVSGDADAVVPVGDGIAVRLPAADRPRFLVLAPRRQARQLLEACRQAGRAVGREAWELTEVEAAVPEIVAETQDAFVPQMVNLQALGGVSFTKGCYAGQEVVARMQYLGKLKRRMYRARAAIDAVPAAGTPLYAPRSPGGQSVGKVVNAVRHPEGGVEMLAVIQIESADNDTVHLDGPDGPRIEFLELPYALDA